MSTLLTYAERTRIIKDWAEQFPGMSIDRRTMCIWKRVGPLLMYISVAPRSNSEPEYKPTFAIHTLYDKLPGAGLMALIYRPNDTIRWKIDRLPETWDQWTTKEQQRFLETRNKLDTFFTLHYDGYLESAEKIRQNSWITILGPISLEDIWQGVERHCQHFFSKGYDDFVSYEVTIPIYTAIWCGEIEKAKEYLQWWDDWNVKLEARQFHKGYKATDRYLQDITDHRNNILHYIDHPDELRQIVKEEVVQHKLEKVPYQNIVCVKHQE